MTYIFDQNIQIDLNLIWFLIQKRLKSEIKSFFLRWLKKCRSNIPKIGFDLCIWIWIGRKSNALGNGSLETLRSISISYSKKKFLWFHFRRSTQILAHIRSVCKKCLYHIRSIPRVKKFLSWSSLSSLSSSHYRITATPCRSVCHSWNVWIQNWASCLVTGVKKLDSLTLQLKALHWLHSSQHSSQTES